jgi:putative transposase
MSRRQAAKGTTKANHQLDLAIKAKGPWGGKRPGAGRPRKKNNPRRRPDVTRRTPVHVSLRVHHEVGRLRRRAGYAAIRRAIAACIGRLDFRIAQVSIQSNHIHLIVEAEHRRALANGLRAFMISAAQHLDRARGRRGRVFIQRYHAVPLKNPRQTRHALTHVLNNWRRHREDREGTRQLQAHVDPYSTGVLFDGWAGLAKPFTIPEGYEPLPVCGARSWLLTVGWRKHHPLIGLRETPGPDRHLVEA